MRREKEKFAFGLILALAMVVAGVIFTQQMRSYMNSRQTAAVHKSGVGNPPAIAAFDSANWSQC